MRITTTDLQNSDTRKAQLTIAINFIFPMMLKESVKCTQVCSGNIKFTSYNDPNEVVDEFFESLCSRYQENLETSMRGSDFMFDSVQLMYYKCHKVNFKRSGSHIDFQDLIKKKKAIRNLNNEDNKCFQYAATVALSHD